MNSWPEFKNLKVLESVCDDSHEQEYWTNILDNIYNCSIDTWDYQWLYACWKQSGLSIIPDFNLVSNIGFHSGATHTTNVKSRIAQLPTNNIWEIKHPISFIRNQDADIYTFYNILKGKAKKRNIYRNKLRYGFLNIKKKLRSYLGVI